MRTATRTATPPATTAAMPAGAPAPISLPTRALFPPRLLGTGLFLVGSAALAITALRPAGVPPVAQRACDGLSAVVVGIHPVETLVVRRMLKKRNVTSAVRRRATISSLIFGVFGSIPALRAIKRASR